MNGACSDPFDSLVGIGGRLGFASSMLQWWCCRLLSKIYILARRSTMWRLGAPSVFADSETIGFASWSRATGVWAQSQVSNLGLDLIGWIMLVMLGFLVF